MNSPGWADKYIFHAINLMQLPCIFDESTKKKHVYLSIILRVPYDTAPMKNCSMHHATLMCIKANGHAQHICASPYTVRILAVTTHKDNSTNFKLESLAPVLELNNTLPREDNVIEVADNIVAHVRVALFPSFDLAGEPSCTGLNIFFCVHKLHTHNKHTQALVPYNQLSLHHVFVSWTQHKVYLKKNTLSQPEITCIYFVTLTSSMYLPGKLSPLPTSFYKKQHNPLHSLDMSACSACTTSYVHVFGFFFDLDCVCG